MQVMYLFIQKKNDIIVFIVPIDMVVICMPIFLQLSMV